jgi:hypothetical protein
MLFIAMGTHPKRVRVNGRAEIAFDDPLMQGFAGAQALVRVTPAHIFPNCPRYIPDLASGAASKYAPVAGVAPIEPGWKSNPDFKDVVPPRKS